MIWLKVAFTGSTIRNSDGVSGPCSYVDVSKGGDKTEVGGYRDDVTGTYDDSLTCNESSTKNVCINVIFGSCIGSVNRSCHFGDTSIIVIDRTIYINGTKFFNSNSVIRHLIIGQEKKYI